jgi:ketosteroid isomerase-like protein
MYRNKLNSTSSAKRNGPSGREILAWLAVCFALTWVCGCAPTVAARRFTSPKGADSDGKTATATVPEAATRATQKVTAEPRIKPLIAAETIQVVPPAKSVVASATETSLATTPSEIVLVTPTVRPAAFKAAIEAGRQSLLQRDLAFAEASSSRGAAEAFYEFMTSDATLLQAGEFPISGIEPIKVRLAAGQQGTLAWKPEEAQIAESGELGYTWGTYEFHDRPDRKVRYGKYVTVWKKRDGAWKIVLSIENSSPAAGVRRIESGSQ